jgi:hypothetical protein
MIAPAAGPLSLRDVLEQARRPGVSMSDLTVLAAQNDPYRVDTSAGHRDAGWFRDQVDVALASGRTSIHLRGLHYSIVVRGDVLKPNGQPLVSSTWPWAEQTRALIERKRYGAP